MNNQNKGQGKSKKSKKHNVQKSLVKQESYNQYHDTVSMSLTCKEIGGFPSVYRWRYSASQTGQAFPISANPSSGFSQGFNYPTNVTQLGWSNLTDIYNSYVVTGSFLRVMVVNKSATSAYRITTCPINASLLAALPTVTDDVFVNNPFSSSKVVATAGSSPNLVNLESGFPVHKIAGLSKPVDQFADSYSGFTGSANSVSIFTRPNDDYYWYISCQSMDGTTIPATTIYCSLIHIYDVVFFDRLPKY
jgi:hypothetical protein